MTTIAGNPAPHVERSLRGSILFSAIGLSAAVLQVAAGVETEVVAIVVVVAALCYLAAAVLTRPWVAWASILGGTAVVAASEVVGLPWWVGTGIAAVALVGIGVARRAPGRDVLAQGLAFLGFGGLAVLGTAASPTVGLLVVGVVLASHGVWDVVHWRRGTVVPRSLAEFCVFVDVPLGVSAIAVALEA